MGLSWYEIASIVVLVIAIFFGKWVDKLRRALREIAEFASVSADALEEESEGGTNVTANEWRKIAKEGMDVINAIKFRASRK